MNENFWKTHPPIPGFDCLKMKNDIQAKIYEETKHMTLHEFVGYAHERAEQMQPPVRRFKNEQAALVLREDAPNYGSGKPGVRKKS